MQSARYQESHRADRCNSDNLTRKQREYYRERQKMKRRKEKRRRRIRSIVSSLEGICLCLVLIAALRYVPLFGSRGSTEGFSGALARNSISPKNGAEAGLLWGEEKTEETLQESESGKAVRKAEEYPSQVQSEEEQMEEEQSEAAMSGGYDFSRPVPPSDPVDDSYFDDAVFIGDSRTEGLITNTGLTGTTSYTYKGLMVDTVFTKPVIRRGEDKVSVMEAMKTTAFSKVYIMFGINENGWPYNDVFIEQYGKIIDAVREINPEAVIYVQEIIPVTNHVSSTHSYIRNGKIAEFNRLLRQMAQEKQVYFIDTASAAAGPDGSLPDEAASDGIHLKKDYCKKWLDYLKSHTVSR